MISFDPRPAIVTALFTGGYVLLRHVVGFELTMLFAVASISAQLTLGKMS